MNRAFSLAATAGLGAGLMYLADPEQGRRRRAIGRDRIRHIVREAGETVSAMARHLANRARGTLASE